MGAPREKLSQIRPMWQSGSVILSFTVANFRTFADPVTLDLVKPSLRTLKPRAGEQWSDHVEPVALVFGPNASGKTALLEALAMLCAAVRGDAPPLHDPYLGEVAGRDHPTVYEVEFVAEGVRHEYRVEIGPQRLVLKEELFSYPHRGARLLFSRRTEPTEDDKLAVVVEPGSSLRGPTAEVARITPPDVLFLQVAGRYRHEALAPVAQVLRTGAGVEMFLHPEHTRREALETMVVEVLADAQSGQDKVTRLLHAADVGIARAEVREEEIPAEVRDRIQRLAEALGDEGGLPSVEDLPSMTRAVVFEHVGANGEPFYLTAAQESAGTMVWLVLAWRAYSVLENGGLLLVDEIDASLHPVLARELVSLFLDPMKNPKGAQLVATTHDSALLGNTPEKLLSPGQVWVTEKNREGRSDLFSLADFDSKPGNNEQKRYLSGRLGGIPIPDTSALLGAG